VENLHGSAFFRIFAPETPNKTDETTTNHHHTDPTAVLLCDGGN
jgi:hypothetical protein